MSRNALLGFGCLIVIVGFAFWLRLPMMIHADRHLDSDLAVDGLVLREYLRTGKLDGTYPGTPHISTLPVFLSLPASWFWGDSPATLVFAGVASAILMIIPVFLMARKAYGTIPAILAGLVLASGGLGQVWLSARVTGGHLLAAAWLAWIWWIWTRLIESRSLSVWIGFGLVCAIAVFSDRIFLLGLAGIGLASLAAVPVYRETLPRTRRTKQAGIFLLSLAACGFLLNGLAASNAVPAYEGQFAVTTVPEVLIEHVRLLFLECLPRLLIGRILPDGATGVTFTHPGLISNDAIAGKSPLVWILLGLFVVALVARIVSKGDGKSSDTAIGRDPRWLGPLRFGLCATTVLTFLAFVLNRNIFNSDNYRYLVLLLPGFGLAVARITSAGPRQSLRRVLLIAFVALLTLDTLYWQTKVGFRAGFSPAPRSARARPESPVDLVDLLRADPPVIAGEFEADYWEVYRALYLADLPIDRGQPFGFFPNRFFAPGSASRIGKLPPFAVITKSPTSMQILTQIRAEGARRVFASPNLEIYERPTAASSPDRPAPRDSESP
jgi:hypothetical protein